MGSSESTPNRTTHRRVRLYLWVAGEDHPKACTGRRLLRRGDAFRLSDRRPSQGTPVLLDPRADIPLSRADLEACEEFGLAGVDCSWNRLGERGGYPTGPRWLEHARYHRRLPFLLAGNPQHFGRLAELNTVEAFAAGLFVLGETERAHALLAEFPGAEGFWSLNARLLESYGTADGAGAIRSAEQAFF